ncbi:penicillin-binding protein 2 [Patescibacteria group bacterium]|nr:penicillin-binding protein 2 [Patescibacteria group bacterium]MCL5409468.1 penicillin-binding protein 2 [Patescibacteria group bacterium]
MRIKKRKLGLAFPEELKKVDNSSGLFSGKKIKDQSWEDNLLPNYQADNLVTTLSPWRILVVLCLFLIVFFGLFLRLFHLQVAMGSMNRELADTNRIQIRIIHAPRGVIYDRNGKVLAENDPGFRLDSKFITRDQALAMEAKNDPKFNDLEIDTIRSYPEGPLAAHILGYVGEISADELKESQYAGYKIGDRIGRAGIEQMYEDVLRGQDGAEIVEIDAQGHKLRTIREVDPIPGQDVYLSLDIDMQKEAYNSLQKAITDNKVCCGALVAENPQTGEILSLVSLPSFDGNAFTDPKRNDEVTSYFNNANSPLLDRVIGGTYPPGSTFKIATALAGLASGKVTATTQFEDTGVVHIGKESFANWYFNDYGKTEGNVDIIKALQRSNDIYFYQVGQTVGEAAIAQAAKKLGMGKKLGIDLPGEEPGVIPTDIWKQQNIGTIWYPGDTLHMSIGQGYVLVTPLQILAETSYIANNGSLVQPHLVTHIDDPTTGQSKLFSPVTISKNDFTPQEISLVQQGLSLVPKQGGTAWPFFTFSVPTAGKTGTAEYANKDNKTHAWYTSYAPENNPDIALTVLVEGGGEGSNVAAPVAKDIYTWYFNKDKTNIKSLDNGVVATASAKLLGE